MAHQPISLTDNLTLPMAFSSRLRKGAQGWSYASDDFAMVIEQQPFTVGQTVHMMANKTRDAPESLIEYTAAASAFYRRSKNPMGPSRLAIVVVALEHSILSTEYEPVGCLGRLMGMHPRPMEVLVGVWTAKGRENLGFVSAMGTPLDQRDYLRSKTSELLNLDATTMRLVGDAAVAGPAQADGLSFELGRERAARPLPLDGLSELVHGALLASILAEWGVHEIEAGSMHSWRESGSSAKSRRSRRARGFRRASMTFPSTSCSLEPSGR